MFDSLALWNVSPKQKNKFEIVNEKIELIPRFQEEAKGGGTLKGKLKCNYSFCSDRYKKLKSNLNKWEQPLEIFKHFIFPLYHMDKKEMYMYAKDKGYHNVLKLTWSCWYPLHNGKPCGKCIMCKERVI